MNEGKSRVEVHARHRLGNLVLVGSDLDRGVIASYLADGALDVPRHTSIKESRFPSFAFGENRLRSTACNQRTPPLVPLASLDSPNRGRRVAFGSYVPDKDKALGFARWLTRRDRLGQVIDENNFSPAARRVLAENTDYISRLWAALAEVNPDFRRAYMARQAGQSGDENP